MRTPSESDVAHEAVVPVARALALLWTYRPRAAVHKLLSLLDWSRADARPYTQDDVRQAVAELRAHGWIVDMPRREGFFRLHDDVRAKFYREALDSTPAATLRDALERMDAYAPYGTQNRWPVYDFAAAVARVRLDLYSGAPAGEIERFRQRLPQSIEWGEVVWAAALPSFDAELFRRVVPEWRWAIAYMAVGQVNAAWSVAALPLAEWALGQLDGDARELPEHLRLALAELLLHRGEHARANAAIAGLTVGGAHAMRAYGLVQSGAFAEAQAAFEAAFKARHVETGARKRVLPTSVAWLYPLALLAQQTPKHLELARKFCVGEAGSRTPDPSEGWGRWVHAIDGRLGDKAADRPAFARQPLPREYLTLDTLWELLLAAWVGREAAPDSRRGNVTEHAAALRAALDPIGFRWLASQVDAAAGVLRGDEPPSVFFVSGPRERWRDVLAALQALGAGKGESDPGAETSRLVWAIRLGKRGTVVEIEALEQKKGPRGYGKPKPVSLARVSANDRLPPWDAKVARAIRKDRYGPRHGVLDRAAAIMALVGHPAVVLAEAPDEFVDVVEGSPELEVVREQDSYRIRVTPSVHADAALDDDDFDPGPGSDREIEALKMITVVRDSPKRLRVIRLTTAQRRAAQLVAGAFRVPAAATQELHATLRSLAAHFQVHDDHAQAAREVEAESRLRAELAPAGERLALRLVAAPLGPDGPRVTPGAGRARLMAAIGGEAVGARRDLAAERANLGMVLDALPFLEEPEAGSACEWMIADPEQALGAVERLPTLAAVAAVEWPKGKPVRVVTVDAPKLGLVVKGDRDWFRLAGRVAVDERTVLDFETVLAAAQSRSRFVPMGEGMYVALAHSLKTRLADLAAVAEADRDGSLRVPRVAALWLDEALGGATLEADAAFRTAIERLRRAQDEAARLPRALQAELRAYQEDGYRWAMRLASAGLGGCLADDMGLGKTLQGLAVLLARGDAGAALVIAPTSVCGNWQAEARRFAPTLNVTIYGEAEREAALANAGPRDVIVVSYTLLQQAQERFAARRWHTVIADEAQAIKNAAAKRAQAVFDLDADFRLALSGTPVENRLAELWSIMRFANPGLLGPIARFTERFAAPIERDRDREAQQRLKRLIGPFVLRRTKPQVLQELPARTELSLAIAPAPAEAAHYEALRRQAVADADRALATGQAGQARMNILAQLTRLRRAACDPRLVSPELGMPGAKVQAFAELASDLVANGHKALVFSQFVDFLTLLRQPLDAAGIAYQYLDGSTPAGERTRRVDAFQAGEGDLFLISLKAGGFGLNLTAADYVLITDPWWNPAAEDQAMGRAHRIGQSRPVTVYRLVTKGTVEERIVELHQDKRALADSILAEGDAALLPSADELVELLRG